MTAVLSIQNDTDREADFQVRTLCVGPTGCLERTGAAVAHRRADGRPPLGRVSIGAGQVVRLVLRQPAQAREAGYRILLDQVPPRTPQPGVVGFALRLSIPVFAEQPPGHIVAACALERPVRTAAPTTSSLSMTRRPTRHVSRHGAHLRRRKAARARTRTSRPTSWRGRHAGGRYSPALRLPGEGLRLRARADFGARSIRRSRLPVPARDRRRTLVAALAGAAVFVPVCGLALTPALAADPAPGLPPGLAPDPTPAARAGGNPRRDAAAGGGGERPHHRQGRRVRRARRRAAREAR